MKQFIIRDILEPKVISLLRQVKSKKLYTIKFHSSVSFLFLDPVFVFNDGILQITNELIEHSDGQEYATLKIKKLRSIPDIPFIKEYNQDIHINKVVDDISIIRDTLTFHNIITGAEKWDIQSDIAIKFYFSDNSEWIVLVTDFCGAMTYVFPIDESLKNNDEILNIWESYWHYKATWIDQFERNEIAIY